MASARAKVSPTATTGLNRFQSSDRAGWRAPAVPNLHPNAVGRGRPELALGFEDSPAPAMLGKCATNRAFVVSPGRRAVDARGGKVLTGQGDYDGMPREDTGGSGSLAGPAKRDFSRCDEQDHAERNGDKLPRHRRVALRRAGRLPRIHDREVGPTRQAQAKRPCLGPPRVVALHARSPGAWVRRASWTAAVSSTPWRSWRGTADRQTAL